MQASLTTSAEHLPDLLECSDLEYGVESTIYDGSCDSELEFVSNSFEVLDNDWELLHQGDPGLGPGSLPELGDQGVSGSRGPVFPVCTMDLEDRVKDIQSCPPGLEAAFMVRQGPYPNRWGARVPIQSHWNLEVWKELLRGYHDAEVVEWMKYGWPVGRLPSLPDPWLASGNHASTAEFPGVIDAYIAKGVADGTILGPFQEWPFEGRCGLSPLCLVNKRNSNKKRVILDLSSPRGHSVNDGLTKDNYLGWYFRLTYPTVDTLAHRMYLLGSDCWFYKGDLLAAFRQLILDPWDYGLIGYMWRGLLYLDCVMPMGLRIAPSIQQRVSCSVAWIMGQAGFWLKAYIDDFISAEVSSMVWDSFHYFKKTLAAIGAKEAEDKCVAPTQVIEFLGTRFNAITGTMEVTPERLHDLKLELVSWKGKLTTKKKQLRQLTGRLQFVCNCVRPGRVFLSRLYSWMAGMKEGILYAIPVEARRDLDWWDRFLTTYSGISVAWLVSVPEPDSVFSTDASLVGYGAVCGSEYLHGVFPSWMWAADGFSIVHLEMAVVVLACKVWASKLQGLYIRVSVDNQAVATVINSGRSRDSLLQAYLRELVYVSAMGDFILRARHIPGRTNVLPDLLSRWNFGPAIRAQFEQLTRGKGLKRILVPDSVFEITDVW